MTNSGSPRAEQRAEKKAAKKADKANKKASEKEYERNHAQLKRQQAFHAGLLTAQTKRAKKASKQREASAKRDA